MILHKAEDFYNTIKNSLLVQLLFQPWYLYIVSGIESALLILSLVGCPLIALTLLPIAINLKENELVRNIYASWRFGVVLFVMIGFIYKFPFYSTIFSSSITKQMDDHILETVFYPNLQIGKSLLFYILLLTMEIWLFTLTVTIPYHNNIIPPHTHTKQSSDSD